MPLNYYCRVSSIAGILRNRFSLLGVTRGNTGKGEGLSIVPEIQNLPPTPPPAPYPGCTTPIPSGGREGNKSYLLQLHEAYVVFLSLNFLKVAGVQNPTTPLPPAICTSRAPGMQ